MLMQKYIRPPEAVRARILCFQRSLLALMLACIILLGAAFYQTPRAQAASSGPIIHWDAGMIYPGQNNGNPWGPVGETAVVHGEGYAANQALKLTVVPGDSNSDASVCQASNTNSTGVGTVTASATGTFNATFTWPVEVAQKTTYSICALSSTDNSVVSSKDDGPFTVLGTGQPTFTVSAASVAAGGKLTISGQNWLPPQSISITVGPCADCGQALIVNAGAQSTGQNSGTFKATITIPPQSAVGNYVVNVLTTNGPLDAYHITGTGTQNLAVTAALPTPTPNADASPTDSTTPTPATTATTTANSATGDSNSSGGSNSTVVIVLIAIVVVLLVIGGLVIFMLLQRKKQPEDEPVPPPVSNTPRPVPPVMGQPNGFHNSMTPFTPNSPPASTPGAYGSYNQSRPVNPSASGSFNNFAQNQPWPGNAQANGGFDNFAQNQPWPGQGSFNSATAQRNCLRCGNPLEPQSVICGNCGLRHTPAGNTGGPNQAY